MRIGIPEKLSLTVFLFVAALALPWMASAALVVLVLAARAAVPSLHPTDRKASARFWKVFPVLLLLVAIMTAMNGVLMRTGIVRFDLGPVALYDGGLAFGLTTGCRLLLIATAFLVLFGSTEIRDAAAYLDRIGLPSPIVTTLLLSLHFLDHLPARIQQIFIAQESRGAPLRGSVTARVRSFFLLLTPLVLSSIVESIDRGMALELRGFHSGISLRQESTKPDESSWSAMTIILLTLAALLVLMWVTSWPIAF